MLDDLHVYDPTTFERRGADRWDGHWAEDFFRYGPGGIGSTYRWEGFVSDHRRSFLAAFPTGRAAIITAVSATVPMPPVSGWPSMTMTHMGDYLGVPGTGNGAHAQGDGFLPTAPGPSGRRRIAENWVCLDHVDLFRTDGRRRDRAGQRASGLPVDNISGASLTMRDRRRWSGP